MPKTSQTPVAELDDDTRVLLIAVLRQHGVRRAGVFGSFARGEQTPESDVDLLIEPDAGATLFTLARLEMALEEVLGASLTSSPSTRLRRARVRDYASAYRLLLS